VDHKVLSIDPAMRSYQDVGVCVLEGARRRSKLTTIPPSELNLTGKPDPSKLASAILDYCLRHNIKVVLLDGPQAWKDPDSQPPYSRLCEKELATPGKTGPFGTVRPQSFFRFVQLCIDVFRHLLEGGAELVQRSPINIPESLLAVETFPTSAWRYLGQKPLPSKQRATAEDIRDHVRALRDKFHLEITGEPNHDQVQAAVAGLAGLSILEADASGYCLSGSPPVRKGENHCEGFIVNPRIARFDLP